MSERFYHGSRRHFFPAYGTNLLSADSCFRTGRFFYNFHPGTIMVTLRINDNRMYGSVYGNICRCFRIDIRFYTDFHTGNFRVRIHFGLIFNTASRIHNKDNFFFTLRIRKILCDQVAAFGNNFCCTLIARDWIVIGFQIICTFFKQFISKIPCSRIRKRFP
ncbi:hypothetical protein IMSAGC012_03756 [Lachnospiraceae bacterium]|nr:hypothetical protein IMSAGC012_03756 [Lachnospiraceae bacterium]